MIILFDGVCNLCNRIVRFVIKRDKQGVFKFASLQSRYGQEFLSHYHLQSAPYETIILFSDGELYFHSDAVLKIITSFGGAWKIAALFKIIPRGVRNYIYSLIAKNRYKIFGKQNTCMVPSEELKNKFMDDLPFTENGTN